MEERNDGIPFGVRLRVGNFYIQKFTRGLSKNEQRSMRKELRLPKGVREPSVRGALPFIRVATISGSWRMEWACTMRMYSMLNTLECADGKLTEKSTMEASSLVSMLYTDSTVLGDASYMKDKISAIVGLYDRAKAPCVSDEEEKEILESEELRERSVSNFLKMTDDGK